MTRRHALVSAAAVTAAGLALAACGAAPSGAREVVTPGAAASAVAAGATAPAVAGTTATAPVAAGAITGAAVPSAAGCGGSPTVTATATGQVSARPDTLLMDLGVQAKAPTARAALAADDTKAARLVAVLRAAGVPAADLQTSNLSIGPDYGRHGVTGYTVANVVAVTLTKLASANRILDEAANAVGNGVQFDNLQFALTNDTAPAIAARVSAVQRAEGRARAMAAAAGVSLGPLCSISDVSSPIAVTSGNSGFASAGVGSSGAAAPPTPIESGSQSVTAQVTVAYEVAAANG